MILSLFSSIFLGILLVAGFSAPATLLESASPRQIQQLCDQLLKTPLSTGDHQQLKALKARMRNLEQPFMRYLFSSELISMLKSNGLPAPVSMENVFECSNCVGSSRLLIKMFQTVHPMQESPFELRETIQGMPLSLDTTALHTYLQTKYLLSNGEPMIVDPSLRQFFASIWSFDEMEDRLPRIFVGTANDIKQIFQPLETHYKLKPGSLSNIYLNSKLPPIIADSAE